MHYSRKTPAQSFVEDIVDYVRVDLPLRGVDEVVDLTVTSQCPLSMFARDSPRVVYQGFKTEDAEELWKTGLFLSCLSRVVKRELDISLKNRYVDSIPYAVTNCLLNHARYRLREREDFAGEPCGFALPARVVAASYGQLKHLSRSDFSISPPQRTTIRKNHIWWEDVFLKEEATPSAVFPAISPEIPHSELQHQAK